MTSKKTLTACLIGLALSVSTTTAAEVVDRIVLRVNNRIATLSEYEQRRDERIAMIMQSDLSPVEQRQLVEEAGRQILREMFDELLVLSRAEQLGIEVTRAQVDQGLAEVRERFGLDTEAQLLRALQQSGLDLESFREQLRNNILYQEVLSRDVYAKIEVEDEELMRAYREHQEQFREPARLELEGLVVLEEATSDRAELQEMARRIHEELLAGRALAEVAEEYAAAGATSQLIDLGWVGPGDLAPALEQAVWELQPGELTSPIPSRGGLHLLHVRDRREAGLRPFEEVQEQILIHERERAFRQRMEEFLDQLEKTAYVVAHVPPEAEGFLDVIVEPPLEADELDAAPPPTEEPPPPAEEPLPEPPS